MRFVIMTNIQIPFINSHSRTTKRLWTQLKANFQLKDFFMQITSLIVSHLVMAPLITISPTIDWLGRPFVILDIGSSW